VFLQLVVCGRSVMVGWQSAKHRCATLPSQRPATQNLDLGEGRVKDGPIGPLDCRLHAGQHRPHSPRCLYREAQRPADQSQDRAGLPHHAGHQHWDVPTTPQPRSRTFMPDPIAQAVARRFGGCQRAARSDPESNRANRARCLKMNARCRTSAGLSRFEELSRREAARTAILYAST